jgi:diamine N-acetyltransferase
MKERSRRTPPVSHDIRLRPTTGDDLDWVAAVEHDPRNEPYVTQWPRQRHAAALDEPATRHLIIAGATGGERLGYVIIRGVGEPDGGVELLRVVVAEPGRGTGRAALRLVKRLAFTEYGAHRLWLDVVPGNTGARALYQSEGFVEEGVMREAARRADGFVDLILMSILQQEWRSRAEA